MWDFHRFAGNKRPVDFVIAAACDPIAECLNFLFAQWRMLIGRRHPRVGILAGNPRDHFAFVGLVWHDRLVATQISPRTILVVQPQTGLSGVRVGTVTSDTVLGKNRADIATKIDFFAPCSCARPTRQQGETNDR